MASKYFRPIVLITAILTVAQSIAWFVMSLLGILAYRCNLVPADDSDQASRFMVYLYFQGPNCEAANVSINWKIIAKNVFADPLYLHGWMCTYITFNVTYFLIAITMLVQLCRTSNEGSYSLSVIRLWTLNTLAFLIMDLWLTIVFGIDFNNIQNLLAGNEASVSDPLSWTASVPGALMAVSARGFVLYVINLALFCYFLRVSYTWSLLFTTGCCQPQNNTGSRQQLHPDESYGGLPRVREWDNGQVLVPVNADQWISQSRRKTPPNSNAPEGTTSFNDWYVPSRPQKGYDDNIRPENKSYGRGRPPSPVHRTRHDDDFARPSAVRSHFEYPDRRNFEQGGHKAKAGARNDNAFY